MSFPDILSPRGHPVALVSGLVYGRGANSWVPAKKLATSGSGPESPYDRSARPSGLSSCVGVCLQVRDLPSVTQYMEAIAASLLLRRPKLAMPQLLPRLIKFEAKCIF